MKIKRKINQESMIGQFPEWWEFGKVVELFTESHSCGLYMMCYVRDVPGGKVLISLENGSAWNLDSGPFDGADYAIEVKGEFVEE